MMPNALPLGSLVALGGLLALMLATPAFAQPPALAQSPAMTESKASDLDDLLQRFEEGTPEAPGGVRLDAWVEAGDAGKELVVMVAPEGEAKLVADPGITVTPAARRGVEWLLPLPHRLVDPEREYLDPPAMVRMPFTADDGQPLRLLVEYAYCFVDYQCYLGEEELTVATVP